jgi:surfeit locus 1 family protein
LLFVLVALIVSAGCVRLGFWQLSRLAERRARNAEVAQRLAGEARPLADIVLRGGPRFTRVKVAGRYDFEREFAIALRPRSGSPGVNIVTPLLVGGSDSAVLVNRGWVYAADGIHAELRRWRENEWAEVDGYVEPIGTDSGLVSVPGTSSVVRRLNLDSLRLRFPYAIYSVLVVQQRDSGVARAAERGIPVRVSRPTLDDGPHLAYAVQWFAFAAVGVVGAGVVLLRDRSKQPAG